MHRNRFQPQFRNEGIVGYVFKKPVKGTVPLYRLYNPKYNSYLLTTSRNEADKMAIDYPPEPDTDFVDISIGSNGKVENEMEIGKCKLISSDNGLLIEFKAEVLEPLLSILTFIGCPLDLIAFLKNALAALLSLFALSIKSMVSPYLSTALYK